MRHNRKAASLAMAGFLIPGKVSDTPINIALEHHGPIQIN
jgi:hypothetical protein